MAPALDEFCISLDLLLSGPRIVVFLPQGTFEYFDD
jgi:hypothetical protein